MEPKEKLLKLLKEATNEEIAWVNEQLNGEIVITPSNTNSAQTDGSGDNGGGNPNPGGPGH